jgi:hypothetical protein
MAANSTERHGQETGWRVTNRHIERQKEMGGPVVTKETVKPIVTHPTQHRILLTSRQRQSGKRTRREEETPGVVNAAKVIMSNMEVSDVKERRERPDCTLSQAEASEVLHQTCQAQVCTEK